MDAKQVLTVLTKYYTLYGKWNNYANFPELRIGTGFSKGAEQRIDLWVMALIPSLKYETFSFEIKVSRSDFLHEIKKPLKRRAALLFSNYFYFATPPGLVKVEELPPECGLVEIDETAKRSCNWKVPAPYRNYSRPNWGFMASVLRRCSDLERERDQSIPLLGSS